jgi:hypothetical protein
LAFRGLEGLREVRLGEKRVARRCGDESARWMWEREREDGCGVAWASFREEREGVVVRNEVGK